MTPTDWNRFLEFEPEQNDDQLLKGINYSYNFPFSRSITSPYVKGLIEKEPERVWVYFVDFEKDEQLICGYTHSRVQKLLHHELNGRIYNCYVTVKQYDQNNPPCFDMIDPEENDWYYD